MSKAIIVETKTGYKAILNSGAVLVGERETVMAVANDCTMLGVSVQNLEQMVRFEQNKQDADYQDTVSYDRRIAKLREE